MPAPQLLAAPAKPRFAAAVSSRHGIAVLRSNAWLRPRAPAEESAGDDSPTTHGYKETDMTESWNPSRARSLAVLVCLIAAACEPTLENTAPIGITSGAAGAPIHGYVATLVNDQGRTGINVPDVQVWAKSTTTSTTSPRVRTNAAGYFHTPVVPPGQYNMCVAGSGFAQRCETTVV